METMKSKNAYKCGKTRFVKLLRLVMPNTVFLHLTYVFNYNAYVNVSIFIYKYISKVNTNKLSPHL